MENEIIDIDFVKWMCERDNRFYIDEVEDTLSFEYDKGCSIVSFIGSPRFKEVLYPLLLAKVIESFGDNWSVSIVKRVGGWQWDEETIKPWGSFDSLFFETSDLAKEASLFYIWDLLRVVTQ